MKLTAITIIASAIASIAISPALADTHAFIWTSADGMKDIGSLGGSVTVARAINDSGQVVGSSNLPHDTGSHAFIWTEAGGMVDLGTGGGVSSVALDVNSSGAVTGQTSLANG